MSHHQSFQAPAIGIIRTKMSELTQLNIHILLIMVIIMLNKVAQLGAHTLPIRITNMCHKSPRKSFGCHHKAMIVSKFTYIFFFDSLEQRRLYLSELARYQQIFISQLVTTELKVRMMSAEAKLCAC